MDSLTKPTGRTRLRLHQNRHCGPLLVLQLEWQDYIVEHPGVGRDVTFWRDARVEDLAVPESLNVATA